MGILARYLSKFIKETMARVSYSQYAVWASCPYKWKLAYKDGLSQFTDSIHTLFGTAMHHVLQEYIKLMYSDSVVTADELDLPTMLKNKMKDLYIESKKEENFKDYTDKEQMAEFYADGLNIIDFFKKHRSDYFSKKGYALIGVEVPISIKLKENINFVGFLDIVVKDEISGDIYIYDFKTSTMGWRETVKKDESKTAQLVLYKNYYAQQYNIPIEKIHVEFIILKRKLYEGSDFPQKRFQRFEPASGKPTVKKIVTNFETFINECYGEDGLFLEKEHAKLPSKKACQYCEFKDKPELCNRKA